MKNKFLFLFDRKMIALLIISVLYLFLSLSNLKYSGYNDDEISPGLWAMHVLVDADDEVYDPCCHINLGKVLLPINYLSKYNFALMHYLLLPFFIIFGINIMTIKIFGVILIWIGLLFIFNVVEKIFDINIAFITGLLLALSPHFIHFSLHGMDTVELILNTFFFGSIVFFIKYLNLKNNLYLACGAFFLSLGISFKVTYALRFLSLVSVGLCMFPSKLLNPKKYFNLKQIIIILAFFLAGTTLFSYYILETRKIQPPMLKENITALVFRDGVKNNLEQRWTQIKYLLSGAIVEDYPYVETLDNSIPITSRKVLLYIYLIAIFSNLLFLVFNRSDIYKRKVVSIYVFYMVMFFLTLMVPLNKSPKIDHLGMLFPFPQLALAIFIYNISGFITKLNVLDKYKIWTKYVVCFMVLSPMLFINLQIIHKYHYIYTKSGGELYWTPPAFIESMVEYLENNALHPSYVLDQGFGNIIYFQTLGSLNPIAFRSATLDYFDAYINKTPEHYIDSFLNIKTPVYFIHILNKDRAGWHDPALDYLENNFNENGKDFQLVKTFYNKIGDPVYKIFKTERFDSK